MNRIWLAFLLAFTMSFAMADAVQVGNTGVTFEPPSGFTKVSQKIIDIKWPNKQAPIYVVGNDSASTTVAYDLKPHTLHQEKISEAQKSFEKVFERVIPGIQWKKNEIIEKAGQKWIYMELTSNAIDTDIYNIILVTGYQQKMLVFNFNSTKEDFAAYEQDLRASIGSIKLN